MYIIYDKIIYIHTYICKLKNSEFMLEMHLGRIKDNETVSIKILFQKHNLK